jgi:hypothetical protein
MQDLSTQQQKKLEKMLRMMEAGGTEKDMEIIDHIVDLEEKVDRAIEKFEKKTEEVDSTIKERSQGEVELVQKMAQNLLKDIKGDAGKDGENYVLTEEDRAAIAASIEVPIVEKVIERVVEKTEVVREIPIVTENITHEVKEVDTFNPNDLAQYGTFVRDGLELLQEEDRLNLEAVRGITVSKVPPLNPKPNDIWIRL